jgi:hypothetical protein
MAGNGAAGTAQHKHITEVENFLNGVNQQILELSLDGCATGHHGLLEHEYASTVVSEGDSMKNQADITVRQATIADLDLVVPLLDAYRQFYRKPADRALARRFLCERFQHNESTILFAIDGNGAAFFRVYSAVFELFIGICGADRWCVVSATQRDCVSGPPEGDEHVLLGCLTA